MYRNSKQRPNNDQSIYAQNSNAPKVPVSGASGDKEMSLSNALDFLITPDSEAEKYPASDKPETGFAAGRSPQKSFKSSDIICGTGEK